MASVFVKVSVNENHIGLKNVFAIDIDGSKRFGDIEKGIQGTIDVRFNGGFQIVTVKCILEEIELPSEEEVIEEFTDDKGVIDTSGLFGVNFILNKIKQC